MTTPLPTHALLADVEILAGPERHGNELRWRITLADGQPALLARLVDELTADPSVRRRYRRDLERLAKLAPAQVATLLAWGPTHDHAGESDDDNASPPWRLRAEPAGESLQTWLERRAPAPPDQVADKLARICDLLEPLHASGFVVRDLSPSKIIEAPDGRLSLIDVGLARTDILSTRTASSLVLEGSPYTAPELMTRTAVGGRADLYALGVLGFRALTGEHPFGDTHALLRPAGDAPRPSSIHRAVPPEFDRLVVALLAAEPSRRPESTSLVAEILRGEAALANHSLATSSCQSCGARMPVGQRLCLSCGKQAVQFHHLTPATNDGSAYKIVLRKAKEDEQFMSNLRQLSAELCAGEVPRLNFVIGDARMYSEAERKRALQLPVTLFNDLDHDTATALAERFDARGIKVEIEETDSSDGKPGALTLRQRRSLGIVAGAAAAIGIGVGVLTGAMVAIGVTAILILFITGIMFAAFRHSNSQRVAQWGRSLMRLRPAPAALPASDPLVARLANLLQREGDDKLAADIHELVSRLALQVQRVVDHRVHNAGAAAEIELALSTLEPLIAQVEDRVGDIVEIDRSLAELDEGRLVRALAAAKARGEGAETKARYLDGLDRLRDLEVERARALEGLARACDLARRSVDMGMRVRDPQAEHERRIKMALSALERRSV